MVPERFHAPNDWIPEQSSWYYATILHDELGNALTSASVTTLTFTWYELDTPAHAIVNGVDQMDLKVANPIGTVTPAGKCELRLRPADTIILNAAKSTGKRRGLLLWTYASGAKAQSHEFDAIIRNLYKVPV